MGVVIEDTIMWIRAKRFFKYWTKRLAKERYGENISVYYTKLNKIENLIQKNGSVYEFNYIRGQASCITVLGKSHHAIFYDSFLFSRYVPYPTVIQALMEHELAHIRVDNHGDDFYNELRKYTEHTDVNAVASRVIPGYENGFMFTCTAKRHDPWKYGIILGSVIYLIALLKLRVRGDTPMIDGGE